MSLNKKILVFTATYNEAENIVELINSIMKQNFNLHLLIIDDNSPDGTSEKILFMQKELKNLFLIKRSKKLGLDTAHKEGYNFALNNDYDYFITMDADLSHDPNELINFVNNLSNYQVVIGSRFIKGGKCLMKGKRSILSKYGNLFIKYFFNFNCNEFTTSYRGFNLKKLDNFSLKDVSSRGYSFFMETVYQIHSRGFSIKQIPIHFADRKKGKSKIPKIEIIRTLFNVLKLKFKSRF